MAPRIGIPLATGAALVAALLCAETVEAQCDFDAPARARKFSSSMVRAVRACPPTPFPAPNTTTSTGQPGCWPASYFSGYSFSDKGSCLIKVSNRLEAQCSNGTVGPCSDIAIKLKCSGILDNADVPIEGATATGWKMVAAYRHTVNDDPTPLGFPGPGNGDMTIVDLPLSGELPAGSKGKLKGTIGTVSGLCLLLGSCPPKAPACSSNELLSLKLIDPAGQPFATLGSSAR